MRVVFMGTPDIAATCLKQILADGFEVVGVYTQPDRPKGRGMKLVASPVKEVALSAGIPVFQPDSFREEETVEQLRALIAQHELQDRVELGGTFCMGRCQEGVCVSVDDAFHSVTPETVRDFFETQVLARALVC